MKTWEMIKELSENPGKRFECGDIIAAVEHDNEIHFTHKITGVDYGACIDDEWMKLDTQEEDDKDFTIICNNCGSKSCDTQAEVGYGYEENSYINGYYMYCKSCGNETRV